MQLTDEPLVNRREILRTLKLGSPTTDAPFHRMRSQGLASPGWSLAIRRTDGRVAGRLHIYSALNVDAARAVRRDRPDVARRLAACGAELERSTAASIIRAAIVKASERLSAHVSGDVRDDAWSDRLQRYLDLRHGVGWDGLDSDAFARDWLVHSEAWLHLDPSQGANLAAAVRELATGVQAARDEAFADQGGGIDSFTGVVKHLDPDSTEIVSEAGEAWVMPRRELDREGLAQLGESVSVVREELPGGGQAWLVAPAVDLRHRSPKRADERIDPFARPAHWVLSGSEEAWLKRALSRDPFILAGAPVPVRDE